MSPRLTKAERTYRLDRGLFDRVIIVPADWSKHDVAWSGSKWVPRLGDVQVDNFSNADEAHAYAQAVGLMRVDRLRD